MKAMSILFLVVAVMFAARYAWELWLYFSDRPRFEKQARKLKITSDENGTKAVGTADRLLISFPLAIALFGLFALGAWHA